MINRSSAREWCAVSRRMWLTARLWRIVRTAILVCAQVFAVSLVNCGTHAAALAQTPHAQEPPATKQSANEQVSSDPSEAFVLAGRYAEVPPGNTPHGKALWALARYQLIPGQDVLQAATESHQNGDTLGTFVLLLCQRGGTAVRRDLAQVTALNFELRSCLEAKEDLTPLELYMLSQCHHGDESGRTRNQDINALFGEINEHRAQSAKRLLEAAEKGVAQACTDIALAQRDRAKAFEWHERAANLGSSTGKRYTGFLLVMGYGTSRDVPRGLKLTQEAADEGDVFAMINMAVYHTQGTGVARDAEQAKKWIEKAAATGHWMGLLEKGAGQMLGYYGFDVDAKAGLEAWQQAARLGSGEVLSFIAEAYADGFGVSKSGRLAVAFAEAAFVQGSPKAAPLLAKIFGDGLEPIEANETTARFWQMESSLPGLQRRGEGEDAQGDIEKRLKAIDPFTMTLE